MPNVVGMDGLDATHTIESATDGRADVQTINAESGSTVESEKPAAGTVLTGLCTQNSLNITVSITT
jgi:hypothetical protein